MSLLIAELVSLVVDALHRFTVTAPVTDALDTDEALFMVCTGS